MPCLLEGAFFVLFLVRTKGAGSLRSTCVSKVAEKVSLWEEKSCQRRKKSGGEDGGKQGLRRKSEPAEGKSEPVGGKSLPGAEDQAGGTKIPRRRAKTLRRKVKDAPAEAKASHSALSGFFRPFVQKFLKLPGGDALGIVCVVNQENTPLRQRLLHINLKHSAAFQILGSKLLGEKSDAQIVPHSRKDHVSGG